MKVRRKRGFDIFRLMLVALPCLFFLPELIGYSMFAGWDVTRLNLPLKWYDVQSIRDGALPLWNHYLYAGMPQLAESESGLFYPGNLLLHLPGDFFYWAGITYILHFILAGLLMDLWLRGRGIKPFVSFFGAVLFQTAPFLLFHITSMALLQSIVWFPLLLWLADRSLEGVDTVNQSLEGNGTNRRLFLGFIAFLGGMLMLIGSAQMAFYQGFLLFWYLVGHVVSARDGRIARLGRSISIIIAIVIGAGLIGAVIWIPASEFAAGTVREIVGKEFYKLGSNWLAPWRLAAAYFFPAYSKQTEVVGWASSLIYVGFLPVFFALFRILKIRVNWRKDAPLIVMGGVALFLAFGMFNPVNHFLIMFPPFSFFRYQGRMALGILVALIALSMHGMTFWLARFQRSEIKSKDNQIARLNFQVTYMIAVAIMVIGLAIFLFISLPSNALRIGMLIITIDLVLFLIIILILKKPEGSKVIPFWFAIYLIFHLVIVFPVGRLATMHTENFRSALNFFDCIQRSDDQPPRLLVVDVGRFADRDLLEFNLWTPQTHLPNLCAGNTGVFTGVQTMDPYTPLRPVDWDWFIRRDIGGGFREVGEDGVLDFESAGTLEFLGIDAVVTSGWVLQIPGYELISSIEIDRVFGCDARLFMAKDRYPRIWTRNPDANVKIPLSNLEFGPNSARTDVSTPGPAVIVEISYNPNWYVTVDGEPSEVRPYEGIFYSVETGTGDHTIEFVYRPRSVTIGGTISIIGLILLLGWLFFNLPWKRGNSPLP